jgi:hypothetical protein
VNLRYYSRMTMTGQKCDDSSMYYTLGENVVNTMILLKPRTNDLQTHDCIQSFVLVKEQDASNIRSSEAGSQD